MGQCKICPRQCKERNLGFCKAKDKLEIVWSGKHFGEEPPISGTKGSGAIFFGRCNLACVYCQNWQISQGTIVGKNFSNDQLVELFFKLQDQNCQNINLISPTVWAKQLKIVLKKAKKNGLNLPIVWNSNAYESVETLQSLKGLVDIFIPDYKYDDESLGIKYSHAADYPLIAQKAIWEMISQVGVENIIIRHLVLPGQLKNTFGCLRFIRSLSPKIQLSLMAQYNPLYKAGDFIEINRKLTKKEYNLVLKMVKELDFKNGWIQEFDEAVECFTPDFKKQNPFV